MATSNYKLSLAHEVVDSPQKAESIAQGHSSTSRYKYKANALLVGFASLRPYDPVYFAGLRDGMSGIWVVISVTHVFNSGLKYTMKVHLGSNDQLLQIKPKTDIKDTSTHSSVIYPAIPNEYASLHSQQKHDSKKYYVTITKPNRLPSDTKNSPVWIKDEVTNYTNSNISQTLGELHPNPYELRSPNFSNVHHKIIWNDR